jgi:LAO/AO transport system kinase
LTSLCATPKPTGFFEEQRKEQANYWLMESIHQELHQAFYQDAELKIKLERYRTLVQEGEISAFKAAKDLMREFLER